MSLWVHYALGFYLISLFVLEIFVPFIFDCLYSSALRKSSLWCLKLIELCQIYLVGPPVFWWSLLVLISSYNYLVCFISFLPHFPPFHFFKIFLHHIIEVLDIFLSWKPELLMNIFYITYHTLPFWYFAYRFLILALIVSPLWMIFSSWLWILQTFSPWYQVSWLQF